jgi:hypothetical protein
MDGETTVNHDDGRVPLSGRLRILADLDVNNLPGGYLSISDYGVDVLIGESEADVFDRIGQVGQWTRALGVAVENPRGSSKVETTGSHNGMRVSAWTPVRTSEARPEVITNDELSKLLAGAA